MRATARALGAAMLLSLWPAPSAAQLDVAGYALGVGSYARESELLAGGSTWLARARAMATGDAGGWSVDVAYEHVALRRPTGGGFAVTAPAGVAGRTDWLGTDWTIHESAREEWRHRFDRLSVGYAAGPLEVTVGRQAVSWATTLVLTPADPFAPFDPSDPFREYRGGVDALRARVSPGAFTEVEAVVRPAETPLGTTLTALGRVQTSLGGWAAGAWAGALHDEAAGAVFLSGAIGSTAVRTEASLRERPGGGGALRMALGLDRYFSPGGRDLLLLAEVQYDAFAADDAGELLAKALSAPFQRGEMQVLSSWTVAGQASYQLHALVGTDFTTLVSGTDGSALLSAGLSWSASAYASVRLGVFKGLGAGPSGTARLGSEYGAVPGLGYASTSWYF